MRDGGKGDTPRPVDKEKFNKNWDEIFKKEKDNSLTFNVDVENQEPTVTIIYKVNL